MQKPGSVLSLNGTRVFEAAARLGSFKAAAAELGVTQSAVSHQVRKLEAGLGTHLFWRQSNGVNLTNDGLRLLQSVSAALAMIARAQETIRRDNAQVNLRVSASFAYRWLVPRMALFRRRFPRISLRLLTSPAPYCIEPDVDLVIYYLRLGLPTNGSTHLLADRAHPVASPIMLTQTGRRLGSLDIAKVPVLAAATDDWDWREWAASNGVRFTDLRISDRFDIDHAALTACGVGVGVSLATESLIEPELRSGALVRLGGYQSVLLGDYWMRSASPYREAVCKVERWLSELACS